MNCPVCKREHHATLSICPSCGAMANDSVREELEVKISPVSKLKTIENKEILSVPKRIEPQIAKPQINVPLPVQTPKHATGEIAVKTTAPTLVEFQHKNSTIPEWRLQLQNAVRQRQDLGFSSGNTQSVAMTSGANALKLQPQIEAKAEVIPHAEVVSQSNPTLSKALQRIADSRRQFMVAEEIALEPIVEETSAPAKNYPFRIAAKAGEILPDPKPATVNNTVKPRHLGTVKAEVKKFDTNKLPPLPDEVSAAFDIHKTASDDVHKTVVEEETTKTELKLVEAEEEIEDIAPFSMRFNAGLFDLIIGSFATLILLAPFMLKGGWFSFGGFLGFLAICAAVMFVYMTVAVGFYGRTLGMRLFSLEVVDIEGENYPTIHQAAVSSSLYLVSMAFGGAGFLTLPFNEEKRAIHDIASGTIVVKEI